MIFHVPSPANHPTFWIRKESASDFCVPGSRLLSQSLEALEPPRLPLLSSQLSVLFQYDPMPLKASCHLPIVATEPSIVATTVPVIDRMGCTFPFFPESVGLSCRLQLIRMEPSVTIRSSQTSSCLSDPFLLITSVFISHLWSLTCGSFDRPLFPHPHHTTPHDIILLMSRGPISSAESLRVKLHSSSACLLTCGSDRVASYDLYSAEPTTAPTQGQTLVDTQVSLAVPEGTYGHLAPRSGLAAKFSLHVGAGIIDPDYRGMVRVLLFNLSDTDFKIGVGDRIAQLILEHLATPDVSEDLELATVPSSSSNLPRPAANPASSDSFDKNRDPPDLYRILASTTTPSVVPNDPSMSPLT